MCSIPIIGGSDNPWQFRSSSLDYLSYIAVQLMAIWKQCTTVWIRPKLGCITAILYKGSETGFSYLFAFIFLSLVKSSHKNFNALNFSFFQWSAWTYKHRLMHCWNCVVTHRAYSANYKAKGSAWRGRLMCVHLVLKTTPTVSVQWCGYLIIFISIYVLLYCTIHTCFAWGNEM